MLSLSDFLSIILESMDKAFYYVYLKGGVTLSALLSDMMVELNEKDILKAVKRIKVKIIYPDDNDLFIELDGVRILRNSDGVYKFIYTCLEDGRWIG